MQHLKAVTVAKNLVTTMYSATVQYSNTVQYSAIVQLLGSRQSDS